jgi:hypothetical protein
MNNETSATPLSPSGQVERALLLLSFRCFKISSKVFKRPLFIAHAIVSESFVVVRRLDVGDLNLKLASSSLCTFHVLQASHTTELRTQSPHTVARRTTGKANQGVLTS